MILSASLALAGAHLGAATRLTQYPLLYEGIPWRPALAVEGGVRLPPGVDVTSSFRLVAPMPAEPSWAVEAGLRAELVAELGRWRPAAGLELGLSTRARSEVLDDERPPGSYFADLGRPEPIWLDFVVTPLRFGAGPWEIGVGRTALGVSLPSFGLAGRLAVDAVTLTRELP